MKKFLDIKAYFKQIGLTYAQAGAMIGASHVYVSNVINGKQELGKNGSRKWADTFGFSYTYLLTGEGSLFDNEENKIVESTNKDVEENEDPKSAEYWKGKYEGAMQQVEMLKDMLNAQLGLDIPQKENVG